METVLIYYSFSKYEVNMVYGVFFLLGVLRVYIKEPRDNGLRIEDGESNKVVV